MSETYVVVGASLAGGTAAMTLRDSGFEGDIVLIGAERHAPYERPPLSKEYLRGEQEFEQGFVYPEAEYGAKNIQTRFGVRVESLDVAGRSLALDDGGAQTYDKLLLCPGSVNRRLAVPGADLDGVLQLRSKEDADAIRASAGPGRRAVVVGMGFIGAEAAASLRQLGTDVVVLELAEAPLVDAMGPEVGGVAIGFHRDNGVEMHFGASVNGFEGGGSVERVTTADGGAYECDFAVVAVGVRPADDLAAAAGIEVDGGILVDEFGRTSADGVYAAGDVTNFYHPVFERRIHVEHYENAWRQAAAAAANMAGGETAYTDIPYFWSDQYEYEFEYSGSHTGTEDLVVRGSLESRDFLAFYTDGGRVVAAATIGRSDDLQHATALIQSKMVVDAGQLADEGVSLESLVPASD